MRRPARTSGEVSARLVIGLGALLACLLASPATALATRTIGLSSPTFDFNVAPGQTGSGQLYVINDGTEPLKVMVYTANQSTDASGNITYEVPKFGTTTDPGPAGWFQILMPADSKSFGNTPYVEMAPGQRTLVKFTFLVPKDAPAGDHQAVIFFEMFEFPTGSGMLSPVTGRVGSRVHVRVPGTLVEKIDVAPFTVPPLVIGDKMPYTFVMRNDGNVDKTVSAKIDLLDRSEDTVQSSTVVTETVLYAHSMKEVSGVLSVADAGIGNFTARLRLTYPREGDNGGSVPAEVTKDRAVWIFPLWLVILVIVAAAVLVLWLMWRAAVRMAERRAARPARRRGAAGGPSGGPSPGAPPKSGPADSDEVYERPLSS